MRPALVPIILADPLPWAKRAEYAWDFLRDRARFAGGYKGALSNTPNWTFTRASTGYAQTSGGVLQSFASGGLRRTDKGVLIEGAGTNLCLQSQTFDNASWTKAGATVTADQVAAPDGTITADQLTENSASATTHRTFQSITLSATTYAYSVYAKNGTRRWLGMRTTSGAVSYFDLQSGVVGTKSAGHTSSSITALANGWYRCAVVWTDAGGATAIGLDLASADNTSTYNGDGTSYLYLWGAQLE